MLMAYIWAPDGLKLFGIFFVSQTIMGLGGHMPSPHARLAAQPPHYSCSSAPENCHNWMCSPFCAPDSPAQPLPFAATLVSLIKKAPSLSKVLGSYKAHILALTVKGSPQVNLSCHSESPKSELKISLVFFWGNFLCVGL